MSDPNGIETRRLEIWRDPTGGVWLLDGREDAILEDLGWVRVLYRRVSADGDE